MSTRILDEIISSVEGDAAVRDVRVGPFWTAVWSKGCGLASTTFVHERDRDFPIKDAGLLTEKSARELCAYCQSSSMLEVTIGVAALNSILDVDPAKLTEINAARVLFEKGAGKRVAIVGHFPFVPKLREVAGELWVIERRPQSGDLPEGEAERVIPQADIVAITGTALINGTMDRLLELCSKDSIVMVLGPTTPLSQVWFDHGVNLVSGTIVVHPEAVLRFVSQGVVFRQLHGRGVKLVTMLRK
ncbi:MAG: DUF364 domain-containing protein [Clostridia bacterium]|nr:DUF364 domain-containing protein [Clostridia bacterium]